MSSLFGFDNKNSSTTSSSNTAGAGEQTRRTGSAEEAGQVHADAVAESASGAPNQSTTTTTTTDSQSNANSTMNDSSRMNTNEGSQMNSTDRSSGDASAASMSGDDAMTRSEERLRVGKESVEAGKARLHKYVTSERVETDLPLQSESVRLEREPITDANRDAALSGPDIKEAEYEVALKAERPVVQKETVPIERVRLSKQPETQTQTVGDELRKEHIEYGATGGVRTNQSQMPNNAASARDNSVQGA